jgi:hypothetical protein
MFKNLKIAAMAKTPAKITLATSAAVEGNLDVLVVDGMVTFLHEGMVSDDSLP